LPLDRHHQHVAARFSSAASTYTDVAAIQKTVARRMIDMVPESVDPANILDAGCGTGIAATIARERWPAAMIHGVDCAAGMIAVAQDSFAHDHRAAFTTSDLMHYQPPHLFDLVISSSTLQWLRPFERGVGRVAGFAKTGGYVNAAIMLDGTLPELRAAREAVAPAKSNIARLPSLEDFEHAVRMVRGARIRNIEQSITEIDFPSARDLLRSIHQMGVTGGDVSHAGKHLTRRELNELIAWYDLHASSPRGVRATFAVGYLLLEVI
jgi:malonyl-CoA O-methyltransferase